MWYFIIRILHWEFLTFSSAIYNYCENNHEKGMGKEFCSNSSIWIVPKDLYLFSKHLDGSMAHSFIANTYIQSISHSLYFCFLSHRISFSCHSCLSRIQNQMQGKDSDKRLRHRANWSALLPSSQVNLDELLIFWTSDSSSKNGIILPAYFS